MLLLDMKTTIAIYVLINYICTFMLFLTWFQNKDKFSGLSFMFYDFVFQSIGMTLASMYGLVPNFLSIALANIFMFSGAILFLFGMGTFLNVAIAKRFYIPYLTLFSGLYIYCTYFQPFFRIRILLFNGMILPVFLHIVYLIFHKSNPDDRGHASSTGYAFILFSILTLYRFYYGVAGANGLYYFDSIKMDNILVVFSILCTLLLTFSLQMMINKKLYAQVERLAITDPLTGIHNRRKIEDLIRGEIKNYARYQDAFCLLIADVDHFKGFNDAYGHDVGDEALIHVTSLIENNIRACDSLGRWGGEEFLIVLPNTSIEKATRLADRLVTSIYENKFQADKSIVSISVSIGVTEFGQDSTFESLIKNADQALYLAKENGRNRFEVYK